MNYSNIYTNLINSRRKLFRCKSQGIYEKHHILPKCLGGDNSTENIVLLTYKEHFIAHKLLVKMHTNKAKMKMSYALFIMCIKNKQHNRNVKSTDFEKSKIIMSQNTKGHTFSRKWSDEEKNIISQRQTGVNNSMYGKIPWNKGLKGYMIVSDETREKLSMVNKGKKRSEETKIRISLNSKGIPKSEEHKQKLSNINKGKILSEDTKRKMSESRKGCLVETHTCLHCGHIGKSNAMKRWHFDNCKKRTT